MTEHGLSYMGRDIFCELPSIKEPQTTLQNKKNYSTKLSENVKSKHQEELWDQVCAF